MNWFKFLNIFQNDDSTKVVSSGIIRMGKNDQNRHSTLKL